MQVEYPSSSCFVVDHLEKKYAREQREHRSRLVAAVEAKEINYFLFKTGEN